MNSFEKLVKDLSVPYPAIKLSPSRLAADLPFPDYSVTLHIDSELDPEDWNLLDTKSGNLTKVKEFKGAFRLVFSDFKGIYEEIKKSIKGESEKASEDAENKSEEIAQQTREKNEKLLNDVEQAQAQEEEELANYTEPEEPEEEIPPVKNGEVKLLDILYDLIEDDLLQIFGHTGTGKTSIAMKAAIEGREAKKSVLYVDTEHNITKKQAEAIKKLGIKYEYIPKFSNLYTYIKKIPKYDIVIIDSLGLPVLAMFADANMNEKGTALQKMIAMSSFLKNYANDNHSLVIVLNQPESDMNKDPNTERKPFGDKSSYCYKEIISSKFAKGGRTENKTTIVVKAYRSRSCGMGTKLFTVEITREGVKIIQ